MRRLKTILFLFVCLFFVRYTYAQDSLSLEDIFLKNAYRSASNKDFRFSPNNKTLTLLSHDKNGKSVLLSYFLPFKEEAKPDTLLKAADLLNDNKLILFEDYQWDASGTKLLLFSITEQIYRRSSRSYVWVYDFTARRVSPVSASDKVLHATFSPDGNKIAYVKHNNIYCFDLQKQQEQALTTDGERNKLIHGNADWVYEEEFELTRAFEWSPDSKQLAFISFDESRVPEYDMQVWGRGLYPDNYRYKYPKAGENNSQVSISVFDFSSNQLTQVYKDNDDGYIPRITWANSPGELSFIYLNRSQNKLVINHIKNKVVEEVYAEKSATYIELPVVYQYLKHKPYLLLSSEKDGYKNLYLLNLSIRKTDALKKLGSIPSEVESVIAVNDVPEGKVYFNYIEDAIYTKWATCNLYGKGGFVSKVKEKKSTYLESVSSNGQWLIELSTGAGKPNSYQLINAGSKNIAVLEGNKQLVNKLENLKLSALEFFSFKTNDSLHLNGWMIKPQDFNTTKKYPVLLYVYGGPGVQTVADKWFGNNYLWFKYLAQQGYIVVSVDGRGTGGRGTKFKNSTYGKLGQLEIEDQIATAVYLGQLPYVDKGRIGMWGWSFGGYMSALAITYGAPYFKMAVSVAPVTSWRFYDSIYTERFLDVPSENPQGYDRFSPITMADKLKGPYLLVHGTADDNVHFQNAVSFQNALIKAGKQFESFYYPDRNHGLYGGNTRYHLYKMMTNFIQKNL